MAAEQSPATHRTAAAFDEVIHALIPARGRGLVNLHQLLDVPGRAAWPTPGTRVQVTHDKWERHGDGAQSYRDDFTQAWPMALGRYRQATTG